MYDEDEQAEAAVALIEAADLLRVAQEGLHRVKAAVPPDLARSLQDMGADTHALRVRVEQLATELRKV